MVRRSAALTTAILVVVFVPTVVVVLSFRTDATVAFLGGLAVGLVLLAAATLWSVSGDEHRAGAGVTSRATGTFELPAESGSVTVDGLGFEPDVVQFTATNNVTASGGVPDRTDAWTYGTAVVESDGTIEQQVLSVANDARRTDAGVVSARDDSVLDVIVQDDDGAEALRGTLTGTTTDEFEVRIDASALPESHPEESYEVLFRAFETDGDANASVGWLLTPTEDGVQTVDLGMDADYLALTAVEPLGAMDATETTGQPVGVCHGVAAREASIDQHAVTATVAPSAVSPTGGAAFDDRALHLLHGEDDRSGRTAARVTDLGGQLELTYDEVGANGELGDGPAQRLVAYLALDTGDGPTPAVDHFRLPAPEDGRRHVDAGFEPDAVEFTACTADTVGVERSLPVSPLAFGLSHGVATATHGSEFDHHVLHSSVSGAPRDVGWTDANKGGRARDAASTDGGVPDGSGTAGAVTFSLDTEGRVVARDELRVVGVDETGFDVEISGVDWTGENSQPSRPVVLYTAWPLPGAEGLS